MSVLRQLSDMYRKLKPYWTTHIFSSDLIIDSIRNFRLSNLLTVLSKEVKVLVLTFPIILVYIIIARPKGASLCKLVPFFFFFFFHPSALSRGLVYLK